MNTDSRLIPEATEYLNTNESRVELARCLGELRERFPDDPKLRDGPLHPLCKYIVAEEGSISPARQLHNLKITGNQTYQPLGCLYRKHRIRLQEDTATDGENLTSSLSNSNDSSDQCHNSDESTPPTSDNTSDTNGNSSHTSDSNQSSNLVSNGDSSNSVLTNRNSSSVAVSSPSAAVSNGSRTNTQNRGYSSISVPNGEHTSVFIRIREHSGALAAAGNRSGDPTPTANSSNIQLSNDDHQSTPPTMMNVKRLAEIIFFFRGELTQGEIANLLPKEAEYADKRWQIPTMIKKVKDDMRSRMIEDTAIPIMMFLLRDQGFFPRPDSATKGSPVNPIVKTPNDRLKFWLMAHQKHPALLIWWLATCIGHVVNIKWYFQGREEEDLIIQQHKDAIRLQFRNRYIYILDILFMHVLDLPKYSGMDGGWDPAAKRLVQQMYREWSDCENEAKDPINNLCGFPEGKIPQIRDEGTSRYTYMYKFGTTQVNLKPEGLTEKSPRKLRRRSSARSTSEFSSEWRGNSSDNEERSEASGEELSEGEESSEEEQSSKKPATTLNEPKTKLVATDCVLRFVRKTKYGIKEGVRKDRVNAVMGSIVFEVVDI
ncbi:hypothetical protein HYALB_00006504 [Hymenoscyphus albidus]|uniref:Uncharacterized protein n=1 Tax=Hymenoscyphus albidus TaxID=595503 RepID=A0A9N9Q5X1_9HELO|nr:hypothetical protein HYALB_00006504 [Hymenoscyphus albidus]